ncbi:MAG: peptidoglycan-binding protein [Magnetospirillum sp.]|nr:peptidoglycan-binding protein [Magnetospirillum sp.]
MPGALFASVVGFRVSDMRLAASRISLGLTLVAALAAPSGAQGQEPSFPPPLSPTQPMDSMPWLGGYSRRPDQWPAPPSETVAASDIRAIQRRLIQLGYDPGAADGTPGARTSAAIASWQHDTGQTVTGVPTLEVERRLDRQIRALSAPGRPLAPIPAELERWRRMVQGKPVAGPRGGIVGHVQEVTVDRSGAVADVIVVLEAAGGHPALRVPLPWEWVAAQIGRSVLLIPWNREDLEWLASGTGAPPPSLAGRKPSWLDGAPVVAADGTPIGTVAGFVFAADGQVAAIMVATGRGEEIAVSRAEVRVVQQSGVNRLIVDSGRGDVGAPVRTPTPANHPPAPAQRPQ